MNNCLITKLKTSIDNDNLLTLDYFTIWVNGIASPSDDQMMVQINPSTRTTIKVKKGTFSDGTTERIISPSQWGSQLILSNDGGIVLVKKTDIASIYFSGTTDRNHITIDAQDLHGMLNINALTLRELRIKNGTTSDFAKLLSLTNLTLDDSLVTDDFITGKIEDFAPLINLTTFLCTLKNVSGNLEDFIAGQCKAGRISGTLSFNSIWSKIHFNGASFNKYFGITYTDTGATVTINDEVIATYTKATNTWTYQ